MRATLAFAATALALTCQPTLAQTVRGVVRDEASTLPLRGVFVMLNPLEGQGRSASLTDADGRFVLQAMAPGRYELSAQLIGYATRTVPSITLAAGSAEVVELALAVSAISLGEISVRGTRRCDQRSQSREVALLWEEAKKALSVAAWVAQDTVAQFRIRSFDQHFSVAQRPISDEMMTFHRLSGRQAFHTFSAQSLMNDGFVQQTGNRRHFFGPDAALLLSEEFQEHHCFRVERSRDRPGLVGLAFEPRPGRSVPDIRGELWIAELNGALQYVDYGFENLGYAADRQAAGGRTEYLRLPNGAWIVNRYEIRMPLIRETGSLLRRTSIHSVQRFGREVLDVSIPGGESLALIPSYKITGLVYDSVRATPLAQARVTLVNTTLETYTDSTGRFVLDSVPRGTYYATAAHARLDSIPAEPLRARVQVDSVTRSVTLSTPGAPRLRSRLCSTTQLARIATDLKLDPQSVGALRVRIRSDSPGSRLHVLTVEVTWDDAIQGKRMLATSSNTMGEAIICGVPNDSRITITLRNGTQQVGTAQLITPLEGVLQVPITIEGGR